MYTPNINPNWNKPSTAKGLNLSKLATSSSNAVPLPYYNGVLWWLFKGKYSCHCGKGFWNYKSYERHYQEAHNVC